MNFTAILLLLIIGLQRSGVILNDRQIRRIQVEHLGAGTGCWIKIEPIEEEK